MPHPPSTLPLPATRAAGVHRPVNPPAAARPSNALRWSLLALFIAAWLALPAIRTLVPPDEGRYAEMAREMLASGDWITPRLNGIKYLEKPPLQTWMNALTFAAFGLGEWQARLWTALCGLLGLFAAAYAARRVFGARIGLYTALILGSSLYWVAGSQVNSLDMGVSAMMTLALACLLVAQRDEAGTRERRRWMLGCWAAMALAVLAKGPIGLVLPGGALLLYALAARDWRIWTRLHWQAGLPLFLAIAAPWFILVALHNPEQPRFFFIHEHVERFLLTGHRREAPPYFYFGVLVIGIMPWLGMLPQSIAAAMPRALGRFQPSRLLLAWVACIFAFFSLSQSKLPGYILPIFPALAMLLAVHWQRAAPRACRAAAAVAALAGLAGLALAPQLGRRTLRYPGELGALLAWGPWLATGAAILLAGAILAWLQLRRQHRQQAILSIAGAGFLAAQLILAGFEPYGRARAGLDLVPAIAAQLQPDTKIYSVGTYQQSLSFYLQRTTILVAYTDEFAFGLQLQPELALPSLAAFSEQWMRDAAAGVRDLAVVEPPMLDTLRRQGLPMRIVAHDARRTVIANR